MLRVTVELVPWGIEEEKRTLKVLEIYNDGTGSKTKGNYGYRFKRTNGSVYRHGRIVGHNRLSESVWNLVNKVLNN